MELSKYNSYVILSLDIKIPNIPKWRCAVNNPLIAVEGIDGSGKSTLVQYIAEELSQSGRETQIIATRERELEHVFEEVTRSYELDPNSVAYMFFFQMLHSHKAERAKKALHEGKLVIADRWDLSFFAWHQNFGFFSTESDELRENMSRLAFTELKPTLGIYLDVCVDKAFDRRQWRGEAPKDIEPERELYTKVVNSYRSLAKQHGWVIIDANGSFDQVRKQSWELVQNLL